MVLMIRHFAAITLLLLLTAAGGDAKIDLTWLPPDPAGTFDSYRIVRGGTAVAVPENTKRRRTQVRTRSAVGGCAE